MTETTLMRNFLAYTFALLFATPALGVSQSQIATQMWSVGPLTKSQSVSSFSFGPAGPTFTAPHLDTQTGSIYSATRSVVFAGDRIVLASETGTRRSDKSANPENVYQLLSLDVERGKVQEKREITAFGSAPIFATKDGQVIVAARDLMRLTPDLRDASESSNQAPEHRFGNIENAAPDGSTLGGATLPGYLLIDAATLKTTQLTAKPASDTSVNSSGYVTDNVHWVRDYPTDLAFVTYVDAQGEHLLFHGRCGGRPQFLTDDLILEIACGEALIINKHGDLIRSIPVKGNISYAGVAQHGSRFALQSFNGKEETFLIYSLDTGQQIYAIKSKQLPEAQSWSAFSPDGTKFVAGSPSKLTLFSLP